MFDLKYKKELYSFYFVEGKKFSLKVNNNKCILIYLKIEVALFIITLVQSNKHPHS